MGQTRIPAADEAPAADAPAEARAVIPDAGGKIVARMTVALLALMLVCSIWLRHRGVMATGDEFSLDRAVGLSVGAATLTGFQQTIGFNDFNFDNAQGPAILFLLTIAGSLYATIAGGMAAVRILRWPISDRQVIVSAIVIELLAVLAGAALLAGPRLTTAEAMQQAACAYGNSGAVYAVKGHALASFASRAAQGVLLPLAIAGGLGLPVWLDLYFFRLLKRQPLSAHSRTVLRLNAGVYVAGTLIFFLMALHAGVPAPGDLGQERAAFLAASTVSIDLRTAGLPFDILSRFPRAAVWLFILLMMVGSNSAGTGGGIKTTTIWQVFRGFVDVFRGRPVGRAFPIAATWIGAYLLVAFLGFMTLCATDPQIPADRLLFLTISAISNVGLSPDPLSIVGPGLFILCLLMLFGRIAPVAVLWWMVRATHDADVLVG